MSEPESEAVSAFVEWYEQVLPAGRTADTRVMNIGKECWRAAVEACACQVESHGCSGKGICFGGYYPRDHYQLCPIRIADELRKGSG